MIREVKQKDFEKIYILGEYLHPNYRNTYDLEEIAKKNYYHIYVYEEKTNIIGFIMYLEIEDTTELIDIVIDKDYRQQKIATQLINRMITNSSPGGNIYLEVNKKNTPAIKLYEKFGFNIENTRKKYYGQDDAYVMKRVNIDE